MMRRKLLLFCCLLLSVYGNAQTNLYVDGSVASSGAGTSWATAYKTLNEALNVANAASTTVKYNINLAQGTYYPGGIVTATNRDTTFFIARGGIRIYGGYPNGGGVRNPAVNVSTLSGEMGTAVATDNVYHVIVASNISAASDSVILDGLTVTLGSANGSGNKTYNTKSVARSNGAALYCISVNAKIRTYNCQITQNTTTGVGAIYANTASGLAVDNCVVTGNSAAYGGGVYNVSGAPFIVNTTFTANSASGGGAIYDDGVMFTAATINNCSFTGNTALDDAGAIYIASKGTTLTNCTFTGNTANDGGAINGPNGAIFSYCTFTNNNAVAMGGAVFVGSASGVSYSSFTGNKSGTYGGGIYSSSTGNTVISYCTFIGDSSANGGGGSFYQYNSISHCKFLSNKAVNGGGLYFAYAEGLSTNDTISGNIASGSGGGIYIYNAPTNATFNNVQITGNKANGNGGAIYASGANSMSLVNATITGNSATLGNGLYNTNSSFAVKNSIIWDGAANSIYNVLNSTPIITYSTVEGGYTGTGNLSTNPLFVSPVPGTSAPTVSGDYQLQNCSPAKDAGLNSDVTSGYSDLALNPRIYAYAVDQGAYEWQAIAAPAITGGNSLCENTTLQLSNPIAGGTWTSTYPAIALVSSTGLVTGMAAGVDTITYVLNNAPNCGAFAKLVVTVYAKPAVSSISGTTNALCANTSIILTCSSSNNGVWSVTNPSLATIGSTGVSTALLSGIATGTDTVVYTVTNANGCVNSSSASVFIRPLPSVAPITGSTFTVCEGKSITLSTTASATNWGVDPNYFASVNNGVVTGQNAGTATVYYYVLGSGASQGCRDSAKATLTVIPRPDPGNILGTITTICKNTTTTVVASIAGGVWSSATPSVATITQAGIITGLAAGTSRIYYKVTNANGCDSQTYFVLTVQAITPASFTQNGTGLTASPNGSGGYTYQWINCTTHQAIAGATNYVYFPPASGQYAVVVSQGSCKDTSACKTVTIGTGGVAATGAAFTADIYPNPTTGKVTIATGNITPATIVVKDITGKQLLQLRPTGATTVLDLAGFVPGIYILEIATADRRTTRKINVMR